MTAFRSTLTQPSWLAPLVGLVVAFAPGCMSEVQGVGGSPSSSGAGGGQGGDDPSGSGGKDVGQGGTNPVGQGGAGGGSDTGAGGAVFGGGNAIAMLYSEIPRVDPTGSGNTT